MDQLKNNTVTSPDKRETKLAVNDKNEEQGTGGTALDTCKSGSVLSLRQILDKEDKPISKKQALALMIELCDHLKARRVAHGELTPNIIALADRELVIDETMGAGWIDPLNAYKPPEALKGAADSRVDVYAMGVILFEMLRNGTPNPVQKSNGRNALSKNELKESAAWIKVHPEMKEIILKCTNYNPAFRYKNAEELKEALLAAAQNQPHIPPATLRANPRHIFSIVTAVLIIVCSVAYLKSPMANYGEVGSFKRKVNHSNIAISAGEKALLANYNLVIIVDNSWSMTAPDAASDNGRSVTARGNTRWDWAENELENLSKQTETVLPKGITLINFNSYHQVFQNCNIDMIGKIYQSNRPSGGTDLGPALQAAFQQEFPIQKPLLIAVISDFAVDDLQDVESTLSHSFNTENKTDAKIAFFRVGGDDTVGERVLTQLRDYVKKNSKKHIDLHTVSFPEFSKLGLAKALAESVKEN